jgi:hypothetical protein
MNNNPNRWIYIALLFITTVLIFLLIYISYQDKWLLSIPNYFFILIIFDLAATGFLTGLLKSSAQWDGSFLKGRLKMTGPVVVFILILSIGYKYKPDPKDDPFDLAIILLDASRSHRSFAGDTVRITLGKDIRNAPVNNDGQAIFLGVDPRYLGKTIRLDAELDGLRISGTADTFVTIPARSPQVISLPLYPSMDSTRFAGYVIKRNTGSRQVRMPNVMLNFTDYDKKTVTDSSGEFYIYLRARAGENAFINIIDPQHRICSIKMPLSKNMQILADD